MGGCQSGFFGGPPNLESNPLLTGEVKVVPPLKISDETSHAMDREGFESKMSPTKPAGAITHSTSSPSMTPRKAGSSANLKVEVVNPDGAKTSPRKETLKRSLTMSASAVTAAPLLDQMNQKFSRSIVDLPVASDIPRMVAHTTVFDIQSGTALFNRSEGTTGLPKPANSIELSKSLILLLFNIFSPDNKRMASIAGEKFDEALPTDFEGDTKDRLKAYLEAVVGNDTPVSAILKCINQGMVAPAIMALRIGLMGKINYKDCGNQWDVEVRIGPSTACVIHQKREQTIPGGCEFVWRLETHFIAPYTHISSVDFHVCEVHFTDDNMDQERKIKIVESLSSFFPPSLRDRYSSMSPSKIGLKTPETATSSSAPQTDSLPNSPHKPS